MKVTAFVLASLSFGLAAHAEDIFDAPEEILGNQAPQAKEVKPGGADQLKSLAFVMQATQATMAKTVEAAIAKVDECMAEMAAAGDTAGHDAMRPHRDSLASMLERCKAEPLLPSIYPLALNRKGCLFAIRETPLAIPRSAKAPLDLKMQVISWFKVNIVEVSQDGSMLAKVLDNGGSVQLYRARLMGLQNPSLKPGVTAQLVNIAFECIAEEQDPAGTIYHLRKIPAEGLIVTAK